MSGTRIEVKGLSVSYRGRDDHELSVVRDVWFTVEPGQILGMVGESGCGKSTTALATMGFLAPGGRVTSGESWLGQENILALGSRQLRGVWGRRVAYLGQNAGTTLNPALTVGRQLYEVLKRHLGIVGHSARQRAVGLLAEMGLPAPEEALRRHPHQFSGGQQQRIALALAIACSPDVLILDEPTTSLDVTTQERVGRLIRDLTEARQMATLWVTHDFSLIQSLSDNLVVMYGGEVVESGTTVDVSVEPAHPYTRALIAAVPGVADNGLPIGIPGSPPLTVVNGRCGFSDRCAFVEERCLQRDIELVGLGHGHAARCVRVWDIPPVDGLRPAPQPRPADPGKKLLVLDGVTCAYHTHGATLQAVTNVSLSVSQGETMGIVGESGSGKSTLLRAIAGVHPPVAGGILFDGAPLPPALSNRSRGMRAAIQLVFQDPDSSLNPRQTVEQILTRPLRLLRGDISRSVEHGEVVRLTASVGLSERLLTRYPAELSGGQRQRVALARAFAARPMLLLCDEVTSALDVSVQATILELIHELAAAHEVGVIFVSHDLAVVRAIATSAIVLQAGEVCEIGGVHELFANPQHPYTRRLIASIPTTRLHGQARPITPRADHSHEAAPSQGGPQ